METETASAYLEGLARRNAAAYLAHTRPRAIILTGSAAEEASDYYSDLDLILYYDALPSEDQVEAARAQNGGAAYQPLGAPGEGAFAETYLVHGVECQVAHTTVAAWEAEMAQVLEQLDVTAPIQKALDGLLHAQPLHGEALVRAWQARARAYPDALALAMVNHYLRFFPLWYLQDRLEARDATLWVQQVLVESAQNILGVLAGLNRVYFSTFQFKRMRRFIGQLPIAPPDLAGRLERLFTAPRPEAGAELEALVGETVALVQTHLPAANVAGVRRLGARQQPWRPGSLAP